MGKVNLEKNHHVCLRSASFSYSDFDILINKNENVNLRCSGRCFRNQLQRRNSQRIL